jgi:dimethylamine monooxygenase subunit B
MRTVTTWLDARLVGVRDLTPGIREFRIAPLSGPPLRFLPGAHIEVAVIVNGQPETRCYSLVGEPGTETYRIAVQRRADSRGGSAYLWTLEPGARLSIGAPKSAFALDFGHPEFLLVAGGIGITPLVGMARQLQQRGARFSLLYAARSHADFAFLDEIRAFAPDAAETFVRSEGNPLDLSKAFAALAPDALCALCGPVTMLDEARRLWEAAGRPAPNLRWETFGSSGHFPPEEFRVSIPRHGLDITVARNQSLLDALAAAGIDVIHDCRRGECGLCAMDIVAVDGMVDHRDVFFSDEQHHENRQLCACVSRARGTLTLDTDFRPDAI